MTFVPPDLESQLEALTPEACPYCQVWPEIPCVFHRRGEEEMSPAAEAFRDELERQIRKLNLHWEDLGDPVKLGARAAVLVAQEIDAKRWSS